jgi:hypothetical protein
MAQLRHLVGQLQASLCAFRGAAADTIAGACRATAAGGVLEADDAEEATHSAVLPRQQAGQLEALARAAAAQGQLAAQADLLRAALESQAAEHAAEIASLCAELDAANTQVGAGSRLQALLSAV